MKTPKEKLIQFLKEDKVIPIIGAGVSTATANLPSWYKLILLGLEYASDRNLDEELISIGKKHLADNELLQASNILKKALHAPKFPFNNWIKDCFSDPIIISDLLINSILDLSTSILLTTNYDTLLSTVNSYSDKQKYTNDQYEEVINSIKKNEDIIVHLHGIYDRPETIILSGEDYDNLNKNVGYKTLLQKLLSDYHFLFIGCSKDGVMDQDFLPVFSFIKENFSNSSNQHFILLHEKEIISKNHISLLTECNIEAINYGNDHNLLSKFINDFNPNHEKKEQKIKKLKDFYENEIKRIRKINKNFVESNDEVDKFFENNFKNKYDWVSKEKLEALQKALDDNNKEIINKKEKLIFTQTIIKSIFNVSDLGNKVELWSTHRQNPDKLDPLNFISTALLSYDCLLKIPTEILVDIQKSDYRNIINSRFYDGYLAGFINEIKFYKNLGHDLEKKYNDNHYLFENLKRIIDSLKGFLELDAENFYTEIESAAICQNLPNSFMCVTADTEITLRDTLNLQNIYARLPIDSKFPVFKTECIKLDSSILVIGANSKSIFSWNPTEDISANIIYKSEGVTLDKFKIYNKHIFIKEDNKVSILNEIFEKKGEIYFEDSFMSFSIHSQGIVCVKQDAIYKGKALLNYNLNGELINELTYDDFVTNIENDDEINKKNQEYENEDDFYTFFSKLDLRNCETIIFNDKEFILLDSRLRLDYNNESSLIFLIEIKSDSFNIIKKIYLNDLCCCSCFDFLVNDKSQLQLLFGFYDMTNRPIMCEEIILDTNFNIIDKISYEHLTQKGAKTRDIYNCKYLDNDNIVLVEEGRKLIFLSTKTKKNNEIILYDQEQIKISVNYV